MQTIVVTDTAMLLSTPTFSGSIVWQVYATLYRSYMISYI